MVKGYFNQFGKIKTIIRPMEPTTILQLQNTTSANSLEDAANEKNELEKDDVVSGYLFVTFTNSKGMKRALKEAGKKWENISTGSDVTEILERWLKEQFQSGISQLDYSRILSMYVTGIYTLSRNAFKFSLIGRSGEREQ
jgi:hypothetical protein